MDPSRLGAIEELFERAQARPAGEREAFLEEACDDPAMRKDVLRLLAVDDDAAEYFDGVSKRMLAGVEEALDASDVEQRIGPYKTTRRLGHGGMGSVYLAVRADGQFEQEVALKLIRRGMETSEAVSRFLSERQILAGLSHRNIAKLLDGGVTDDGRPYFVMEHVPGVPIDVFCAERKLGLRERVALMIEVGEAVAYAHRNLVVHRDLKPSNILVDTDGVPKLLDFGIAKPLADEGLTRTGMRAMTPEYAAPEQIRGQPVTTLTDVYGLGLVLYEVLTGTPPFRGQGRSGAELELSILHDDPARPSSIDRRLRGDLEMICLMALRKEPERRYASAEQLCADLRAHRDGLPVLARPDTLAYRASKFVRRNRVAVVAAAIVLVTLVGSGVSLALQLRRAERERDKAAQVSELLTDLLLMADPSEHRGADVTARDVLDRGAATIERLDDQPEVQATLMDVMGRAYRNLGEYDRAEPLLVATLEARRRLLGPRDPAVGDTLRELGDLHRLQGRFDEARTRLDEALALHRAALGEDDPRVGDDLAVLGRLLIERGALPEAEERLREGLAVHERAHGASHAVVAEDLNDLGSLQMKRGRYDEAVKTLRLALEMRKEHLGADHPKVPASLNNLASALMRAGDLDGAEASQREALAIYERIHGERHPAVATTLSNLGVLRFQARDPKAAEDYYRRALDLRRELLGPAHPEIAQTASNLGLLLQQEGRAQEAEPLLREALKMRRALLAAGDPRVGQSLNNLGLLLHAQGDLAEAEGLLREGLALLEGALGNEHPNVATNINNLGMILADRGQTDEAKTLYERALAMRRKLLPDGHPHLAYSLLGLGRILCTSGDAHGRSLLDEAAKIRTATLPEGHRDIAAVEAALAQCP